MAEILLLGCEELSKFTSPRLSSFISIMRKVRPVAQGWWESANEVMPAKHLAQGLAHRSTACLSLLLLLLLLLIVAVLMTASFMGLQIKRTRQVNAYNAMWKHQQIVNAILCHQPGSPSPSVLGPKSYLFLLYNLFLVRFPPYFTLSYIPQNLTECYMDCTGCLIKHLTDPMDYFLLNQPVCQVIVMIIFTSWPIIRVLWTGNNRLGLLMVTYWAALLNFLLSMLRRAFSSMCLRAKPFRSCWELDLERYRGWAELSRSLLLSSYHRADAGCFP